MSKKAKRWIVKCHCEGNGVQQVRRREKGGWLPTVIRSKGE